MTLFLSFKHAVKCEEMTADMPKGAAWKITAVDERNDCWRAWKWSYRVNNDAILWVPLNREFPTPEAAAAGVKEFVATLQPVFLNEAGDVVTEPYMVRLPQAI